MLFVKKHQFFTFVTTEKNEENFSLSTALGCGEWLEMRKISYRVQPWAVLNENYPHFFQLSQK